MISLLIIPVVAVGFTLLYASVLDIRDRRVPFRTWYPMIITGLPFTVLFYILLIAEEGLWAALPFLILIILFSLVFYLFARFHLYGGADAWALIFITVLVPTFPVIPILGVPPFPFLPFTTLVNAVIINLFTPIGILIYNLRNGNRAPFPYLLLGFPVEGDRIIESHGFVMEEITEEEGALNRRFVGVGESLADMVRGEGRVSTLDMRRRPDEYSRERELYEKAGRVWISYGVPFIVPITFGFVSAFVAGDLVFALLQIVMGG